MDRDEKAQGSAPGISQQHGATANVRTLAHKQLVEAINFVSAVCVECHMMKACIGIVASVLVLLTREAHNEPMQIAVRSPAGPGQTFVTTLDQPIGREAKALLIAGFAGGGTILRRQHIGYPLHVTRAFYLDRARADLATLYLQRAGFMQGAG